MPSITHINPVNHRSLKVGGFVPFSTTDFPGKLAAVVFVQGCPWECVYCHNPHLQPRTEESPMPWADVLALLKRRAGLLDAVVFSGGEPTLDPALEDAIRDVRALGFQIGLHTGGAYPKRLAEILPLIDWIGLDVKASFTYYERITGVKASGDPALACTQLVVNSGIAHECRTTIHPSLFSNDDLLILAKTLAEMGVTHYALQVFREQGCDNESLTPVSGYPDKNIVAQIAGMFRGFALRDA
ncbi:MAG: anaerobic ribonucleoside-triphosphate reductase activating protein [Oxalobacter sp.]|nr:MAG: anaerobic ribonucleoside-triphosphate reductase activating protein [Oxalobacter sp.]